MNSVKPKKGSLTVVGTGIEVVSHLTTQAEHLIFHAEKVFFVVPGPWADEWMQNLNQTSESLTPLYHRHTSRLDTYNAMVEKVMEAVRQGLQVCAVFYGHPGVFVLPSNEMIKQARAEGYQAKMYPAVSAEDCLFAELGVDPSVSGCQSFEATDFLLRHRVFDPYTGLILWQIGMIGHSGKTATKDRRGLKVLANVLTETYGGSHKVTVYEAPMHPEHKPRIERIPLKRLPTVRMTTITTLYVPPIGEKPIDPTRLALLGMSPGDVKKDW